MALINTMVGGGTMSSESCAEVVPQMTVPLSTNAAGVCSTVLSSAASALSGVGLSWTPPGTSGVTTFADECCATCA